MAFAKLRKATFSFVMSVCPSLRLSVRMEQLTTRNWKKLHEIYVPEFFENLSRKYKVSLEAHKNERYFKRILRQTYNISLSSS